MNLLKYLADGFVIGIACLLIPQNSQMSIGESISIGILASSIFCILDLYGNGGKN